MINRINFSIFLGFIITACGTASTQEGATISGSDFSMDSVIIYRGDQLIFPYIVTARSFFTENKRFLFNFNDFDHSLEKIDLDKLELTDKYPFAKDGRIWMFQNMEDEVGFIRLWVDL